jgi:hypothetical protein
VNAAASSYIVAPRGEFEMRRIKGTVLIRRKALILSAILQQTTTL